MYTNFSPSLSSYARPASLRSANFSATVNVDGIIVHIDDDDFNKLPQEGGFFSFLNPFRVPNFTFGEFKNALESGGSSQKVKRGPGGKISISV